MTRITAFSLVLATSGLVLASRAGVAQAAAPSAQTLVWSDPYDQAYWSRPHNTYQKEQFDHLDYALWDGFYALELDIHEYKSVGGLRQFPVKHDSGDGDTTNNCTWGAGGYLRDCLNDIRNWSDYNPYHPPISVQIDLKVGFIGDAWRDEQFDELHRQVAEVFGDKLYRPNQLRMRTTPAYDSLRASVAINGWPSLAELQGKVLVFIMGGPLLDKNDTQENYVRRYRGDANFFVCPNANNPDDFYYYGNAEDFDEYETNKWVVCGNVGSPKYWKDIAAASHANRQLMNLWESGIEYDEFSRMYRAVGWGASMISRGNSDTFGGKLPLNGRRRSVPVEFSIANEGNNKCVDVRYGSYSNGSDVIQSSCTGATSQRWIYSDEGQLRAKGDPDYCFDIEGGDGDLEDRYHLWDCDGGESEKWRLTPEGFWVGMNGRCMDVPYGSTSNNVRLWHYDCNQSTPQRFYLSW
jgi:hypothetical protein